MSDKKLPHSSAFVANLTEPTVCSYNPDTGVFSGHMALWNVPHRSAGRGGAKIYAPRNPESPLYYSFMSGSLETSDAGIVRVGRVLYGAGHSFRNGEAMDPARAGAYHQEYSGIGAFVAAGEDEFGIWVSGVLNPDMSEEDRQIFLSGTPSGEWFPYGTAQILHYLVQVNTPGYPIPRVREGYALAASFAPSIDGPEDETPPDGGAGRAGMADNPQEPATTAQVDPAPEPTPVPKPPAKDEPKDTTPKDATPKENPKGGTAVQVTSEELGQMVREAVTDVVKALFDERDNAKKDRAIREQLAAK